MYSVIYYRYPSDEWMMAAIYDAGLSPISDGINKLVEELIDNGYEVKTEEIKDYLVVGKIV